MSRPPRIGVFGGTFDPPHLGHLILAAEAAFQLGLDKVLWVLTPDPPHKRDEPHTPWPRRAAMVLAAIGDNDTFELSTVDIDRPGPHYAVDTMRLLRLQDPHAQWVYLMGGDSLHGLPTWHHVREFIALCDELGVMRRPGDEIDLTVVEACLPGVVSKVRFVNAPLLQIAASELRERAQKGAPIRYYLPEAVYALIREWRLYRQS